MNDLRASLDSDGCSASPAGWCCRAVPAGARRERPDPAGWHVLIAARPYRRAHRSARSPNAATSARHGHRRRRHARARRPRHPRARTRRPPGRPGTAHPRGPPPADSGARHVTAAMAPVFEDLSAREEAVVRRFLLRTIARLSEEGNTVTAPPIKVERLRKVFASAAESAPSTGSTWRSSTASSSACSARTAPASRRRSACSRRASSRRRAGRSSAGIDVVRRPGPRQAPHRRRPADQHARPGADGLREPLVPRPLLRHVAQAARRREPTSCSSSSASPTARRRDGLRALRRHGAAADDRAGAGAPAARSCSSTSPRPASTRRPASRSGTSCASLHAAGQTILLTTHYMEEADALCERRRRSSTTARLLAARHARPS